MKYVYYIKRIIGLPGETLEIKNGPVYIDNSSVCLSESYLKEQPSQSDFGPYIIPENQYFVMGDNRNYSNYSRHWQKTYVPLDTIFGKVVLISTTE